MEQEQAKKILDQYFKILQETEGKCVARDQATLPTDKEQLREAHFVYVKELIKNNSPYEVIDPFINSFNRIVTFTDKQKAEELNKLWSRFRQKPHVGWFERHGHSFRKYMHYFKTDFLGFEPTMEIVDFIHKTCKSLGKPSLVYQESEVKNVSTKKYKILLVDDDKLLLDVYSVKLGEAGLEVETWLGIPDGDWIEKVVEIKPDLISMDVIMPKIDGFQAMQALKSDPRSKDIPIFGFDNLGQREDFEQAYKAGAVDYFVKAQITPTDLVKTYLGFLNNPQGYQSNLDKMFGHRNKKHKILLVDDDKFIIDVFIIKFTEAGWEVQVAFSADEALDKFETGYVPDLMMTDIIMPGMDGFQLLKILRDKGYQKKMATVILSNLGQQDDIERAKKLGIDGYIVTASATPDEVVERVTSILDNKTKKNSE